MGVAGARVLAVVAAIAVAIVHATPVAAAVGRRVAVGRVVRAGVVTVVGAVPVPLGAGHHRGLHDGAHHLAPRSNLRAASVPRQDPTRIHDQLDATMIIDAHHAPATRSGGRGARTDAGSRPAMLG